EAAAAGAGAEAHLAVVVHEVAQRLAVGRHDDADAVVPAHLAVADAPAVTLPLIADRALLIGAGVFFDDDVLYRHVAAVAAEGERAEAELDGAAGRVVGEIDRLVAIVIEERAGPDLRFLGHGAQRLAVEIKVLRMAAARKAAAAFAVHHGVRIDRLIARDIKSVLAVEFGQQLGAAHDRSVLADEDVAVL